MLTIRTNNHWRNLTYGYELSASERADFDYIDLDDLDYHEFIRYRGIIYDPSEFMAVPTPLNGWGWQGYQPDSYFSGVVIRYSEDYEQVQIGTYYS